MLKIMSVFLCRQTKPNLSLSRPFIWKGSNPGSSLADAPRFLGEYWNPEPLTIFANMFKDLRSFNLGGGVTLLLYLDSVDLRNEGSADAFLLLKIEKYIRSLTVYLY